jgi:hypothetical protein
LAAFVHSLEATAQDDVLEVLEIRLHELFGDAEKADKKARLRTLKDLDGAAATLADVCRVLLDPALPDDRVRRRVFEKIPQPLLERELENVEALIRPPDDVFYKELDARYAAVRRYLPMVLKHLRFEASPAGKPVCRLTTGCATVFTAPSRRKIRLRRCSQMHGNAMSFEKTAALIIHAYTFCMLDQLVTALHRRDVLPSPVGAMLTHAQICWVSRNGRPCVPSYAAHSGSLPSHNRFSTR